MKDPLAGKTLRGYRIDAVVSRSAEVSVYRATQVSVARPVALKVLAPQAAKDPRKRTAFLAAARAAGGVEHRNIVAIHEVVSDADGFTFASMEWADGGSLRDVLARHGRIPWRDAVTWLASCLRALVAVERAGSVQVTPRPEHVLFTKGGEVKVLLPLAPRPPWRATPVSNLVYLPPEYIAKGQVDHSTAVYALGVTFAEVLSGRAPFAARTRRELLAQKRERAAPEAEDVADIPMWLLAFLQMAAHRHRVVRLGGARHLPEILARDLARMAEEPDWIGAGPAGRGRGPAPVDPPVDPPAELSVERRTKRGALIACAVAAGILLAAGAFFVQRGQDDGGGEPSDHGSSRVEQPATEPSASTDGAALPHEASARREAAQLAEQWREVEREIGEGRLREAARTLADLAGAHPAARAEADARLAGVLALARERLDAARERGRGAARGGDFDGALAILDEAAGELPERLGEELATERRAIAAARQRATDRAALVEKELEIARAEALELRFDAAIARVGALSIDERDDPAAREILERLAELRDLARAITAMKLASADELRRESEVERLASLPAPDALRGLHDELLAAAVMLRARAIAAGSPAALVAASSARLEKDELTLVYEFEPGAALDDFSAAAGSTLEIDGEGRLRLRGECRLLDGEPFRDRLRVDVTLADGAAPAAPLGVALWTAPGDRVTFDPARGGNDRGDPAYDYVVCGLAYDPRSELARALACPGEEYPVLYPCDVLLVGAHGSPLHAAHGWNCLWGETLLASPGRRRGIVVEESRAGLRWEVEGVSVPGDLPRAARDALAKGPRGGRTGSTSLFTGGALTRIERLRVAGRIDASWWERRARRVAARELKERLPEIDWPLE